MTSEQQALLLTTARILRAHLRDTEPSLHPDVWADIADLNDALAPFDGSPEQPTNEAATND